ncbi:protein of unknown function [Cyanobium sp. NIES-981]|nr:protein of unknown function [Cyanobium sp. NIES-981]
MLQNLGDDHDSMTVSVCNVRALVPLRSVLMTF